MYTFKYMQVKRQGNTKKEIASVARDWKAI